MTIKQKRHTIGIGATPVEWNIFCKRQPMQVKFGSIRVNRGRRGQGIKHVVDAGVKGREGRRMAYDQQSKRELISGIETAGERGVKL